MASAYSYLTTFSLLFIILSLFTTLSLSDSPSSPSPFDILPKYGLPSGLLPDCVKNYTLSPEDGHFVVDLEHTCYIQFDYLVYYDTRITGTLNLGSITDLKGVQVKQFFLWFNLDEIKVDLPPSDYIYFQVGIVNKKLSVHQFETVHSCRAGTSASRGHLRSWSLIFEDAPDAHTRRDSPHAQVVKWSLVQGNCDSWLRANLLSKFKFNNLGWKDLFPIVSHEIQKDRNGSVFSTPSPIEELV